MKKTKDIILLSFFRYYKFIERNEVDESNRGGNSFTTFSVRYQQIPMMIELS